jgi:threonine dehydrogenase-like Zn-dependent dehydrogenase
VTGGDALGATMPAAVLTGPAAFEVHDLPVPVPGPDEVLVEVGWCGICGTDLHLALEGYGRPGTVPLAGKVMVRPR